MEGEVIGINTAILSPTGGSVGIGFAVPASTAMPIIEQLRQFGETRRGWLGVRIQSVDDATAEALSLGAPRGALVAGIDDKGPAKPSGLEVGDVIVRFDGREVKDSRDLPRIVASTPVGKAVEVIVMRKGQEQTKQVTLGRLEDGEKQQQANLQQPPTDTPTATRQALGLSLSGMTDDLRRRFSLKDDQKGVVVTRVDPNSAAADKRIQPGDIIVEVGQEPVSTPGRRDPPRRGPEERRPQVGAAPRRECAGRGAVRRGVDRVAARSTPSVSAGPARQGLAAFVGGETAGSVLPLPPFPGALQARGRDPALPSSRGAPKARARTHRR